MRFKIANYAFIQSWCKRFLSFVLVSIAALLIACQFESDGGLLISKVIEGTVTKVHDGDSIHITPPGEERVVVRLAAIDAPEIKQEHGIQSRDFLRAMVMGQTVTAECNKVDKYRRNICVVILNQQDINLKMLSAGHAWYYTRFRKEQRRSNRGAYEKAESQARKRKAGLWMAESMPPWTFRSLASQ